jgi:hypothetical protein
VKRFAGRVLKNAANMNTIIASNVLNHVMLVQMLAMNTGR